ncbi:MAG: type II toxin-antitoxin system ParD family antitoxin [Solirubrobacterales bacterium]|nr:type II toxin-antitoxin system ParD family antitoxin [Solirubrobacterales bacterium]
MALRVPADLEERIRQKVESGEYDDAVEVIRAAMRLLDRRDAQLQELRASIAEGLAAIERGEGVELTPEVMDEIEREADERLRLGLSPKPDVCP